MAQGTPKDNKNDARTQRALRSAARWLRRRGKSREHRETRQAYNEAAALILNRARR